MARNSTPLANAKILAKQKFFLSKNFVFYPLAKISSTIRPSVAVRAIAINACYQHAVINTGYP